MMAMIEKDLIGVGFGPSNLAFAIALAENQAGGRLNSCFIERSPSFSWHSGMLIERSKVQISFLKDLATLRDPTSRFTFVNYLHATGRLQSFINLKQANPSRAEFTNYFRWAAAAFEDRCCYGETVESVEPVSRNGRVARLLVTSVGSDGERRRRMASDLVVGVGGRPYVPPAFEAVGRSRIAHASQYMTRARPMMDATTKPMRVAVVGGGQSGAEIFRDIAERWPHVDVSLVLRDHALRPADDSPFVNEAFDPSFVDLLQGLSGERRKALLNSLRNTNYSVVDLDLIEQIYGLLYERRFAGASACRLLTRRNVEAVREVDGAVEIETRDVATDERGGERFDLVILATGYRYDAHERILANLASDLGGFEVDRFYRVKTPPSYASRIYLQGCNEDSHGLSDTLLSILPLRASEIVDDLLSREHYPMATAM
ncbi:lysine N(6)-hydroxylase/L-ornithine N(5)-oxygenase family protein [Methylocella sp.]|uniref:lysine N(6)-hydroxylase/L-ornithine N(5)-oxygenase family protein n=1 Tax=Methylocella sp. TaxID=1978226 RepID=UPI003785138C